MALSLSVVLSATVHGQAAMQQWTHAFRMVNSATQNDVRAIGRTPGGSFFMIGNSTAANSQVLNVYSRSGSRTSSFQDIGTGYFYATANASNRLYIACDEGVYERDANGAALDVFAVDAPNGYSTIRPKFVQIKNDVIHVAGDAQQSGGDPYPFVYRLNRVTGDLISFDIFTAYEDVRLYGMAVTGNGHTYITGYRADTISQAVLWKVNAPGGTDFFQMENRGVNSYFYGVLLDGQDRPVCFGEVDNQATIERSSVGGTIQVTRTFPDSATFRHGATGRNGNHVLVGTTGSGDANRLVEYKQDLSETLGFERGIPRGAANQSPLFINEIFIDDRSEIYLFGNRSDASATYLGKYSASSTTRFVLERAVSGWSDYRTPGQGGAVHYPTGDMFIAGGRPDGLATAAIYRQAPTAIADGFNVKRNSSYKSPRTVTNNDRSWQGTTSYVSQSTSHGQLVFLSNGTFTYTPQAGYVGTDTFTYTLVRPGVTSSTATVQLHVQP